MTKGNKRLEGETFDDYRLRLRNEQFMIKRYLKGRVLWLYKGTYVFRKHGNIRTDRLKWN